MNEYFLLSFECGDTYNIILVDVRGPYSIREAKRDREYLLSLGIESIITKTVIGLDGREVI